MSSRDPVNASAAVRSGGALVPAAGAPSGSSSPRLARDAGRFERITSSDRPHSSSTSTTSATATSTTAANKGIPAGDDDAPPSPQSDRAAKAKARKAKMAALQREKQARREAREAANAERWALLVSTRALSIASRLFLAADFDDKTTDNTQDDTAQETGAVHASLISSSAADAHSLDDSPSTAAAATAPAGERSVAVAIAEPELGKEQSADSPEPSAPNLAPHTAMCHQYRELIYELRRLRGNDRFSEEAIAELGRTDLHNALTALEAVFTTLLNHSLHRAARASHASSTGMLQQDASQALRGGRSTGVAGATRRPAPGRGASTTPGADVVEVDFGEEEENTINDIFAELQRAEEQARAVLSSESNTAAASVALAAKVAICSVCQQHGGDESCSEPILDIVKTLNNHVAILRTTRELRAGKEAPAQATTTTISGKVESHVSPLSGALRAVAALNGLVRSFACETISGRDEGLASEAASNQLIMVAGHSYHTVWDLDLGRWQNPPIVLPGLEELHHPESILRLDEILFVGCRSGCLHRFHMGKQHVLPVIAVAKESLTTLFQSLGRLYCGSTDHSVTVLDATQPHEPTLAILHRIDSARGWVRSLAATNQHLFVGGGDQCIRIFDLRKDLQPAGVLRLHAHYVTALAIVGPLLFSGSADHSLIVWNLEASPPTATLR